MQPLNHDRFIAGNQELREILRRAEGLENLDGRVSEQDVKVIGARLLNVTPEVGDASRTETLDACLLTEVAEYVTNLRSLQRAIEKINCSPFDRRVLSESQTNHPEGLQEWLHEYLQTV
jgi:hypothetical protein